MRSIAEQTVLPAELCVVDSSDEPPGRAEVERLCAEAGIALDYVHPAPRGLTIQRNIGIERTTGDPVFLIDDDVMLAPDVHEEILAEYARWGSELGGVRGAPVYAPSPGASPSSGAGSSGWAAGGRRQAEGTWRLLRRRAWFLDRCARDSST